MIAQMYLMVIDTDKSSFEELPEVERQVTDFIFDSHKVTGIYKQDEDIMVVIMDSVDIPLVFHEYTYECIKELLVDK